MHKQISEAVYETIERKVVKARGKKIKDAVWEYRCDYCNEIIENHYTRFLMFTPEVEETEWDWGVERRLKLGISGRHMTELCSPEHGALYIKKLRDEFKVVFSFDFLTGITPDQMKKFAKVYVEES